MTDPADFFLKPASNPQRQYEALRAVFVEKLPSTEVGERFGYAAGTIRNLCHRFRQDPSLDFFFQPTRRKPRGVPKAQRINETIVELRKQNLSIYDISDTLKREYKISRTPQAVASILRDEGFARLPRRRDEERPLGPRPEPAAVADVQQVDWSPRQFRTKFGGLFLFVPYLAQLPFDKIMTKAGLPGSKMIPAGHAMRSLLALKLFGNARQSHVMSYVFDPGLALFPGLNVIPKRSFLTEYSCRVQPDSISKLMQGWFDAIGKLGLARGASFDLDFHTIPFHGDDALVEKHYVSRRSRRQKGVLAFLARDADKHVFCYANSDLRKDQQNDEILQFVQFWKKRTGRLPEELVFDSKLTTYRNLNILNKKEIQFITLRRRSPKLLAEADEAPPSAWRQVRLDGVTRAYKTPWVLDRQVTITGYDGPIRQFTITDLGHDAPTILLTNQLKASRKALIERYAHRMLIENGIADGIDFFHMDALSSAVAMKVNVDLQLTLMASSLYRLLGAELGRGYEKARSRHIFQHFVDATAQVSIAEQDVIVRLSKRAHNPFLAAAGFDNREVTVPWWDGRRLILLLG
jgi:transposase